jgi:hypothetical protein
MLGAKGKMALVESFMARRLSLPKTLFSLSNIDVINIRDRLTVDVVCGRLFWSDPAFLVSDSGSPAA